MELNINHYIHFVSGNEMISVRKQLAVILSGVTIMRQELANYFKAREEADLVIGDKVDTLVLGISNIAGDVRDLKLALQYLQDSPGPWTVDDQSILDKATGSMAQLQNRIAAAAKTVQELDEATPPATPIGGVDPPLDPIAEQIRQNQIKADAEAKQKAIDDQKAIDEANAAKNQ